MEWNFPSINNWSEWKERMNRQQEWKERIDHSMNGEKETMTKWHEQKTWLKYFSSPKNMISIQKIWIFPQKIWALRLLSLQPNESETNIRIWTINCTNIFHPLKRFLSLLFSLFCSLSLREIFSLSLSYSFGKQSILIIRIWLPHFFTLTLSLYHSITLSLS